MKGTNEKWTVTKINFREKVAKNVDLVHFSIGAFQMHFVDGKSKNTTSSKLFAAAYVLLALIFSFYLHF